jgi:hypothetical protein
MRRRGGEIVDDPDVLACKGEPCPVATVGQFVEVKLDRHRAEVLGFEETVGKVKAVTPFLHGIMIEGPMGDVIVGGHHSTDRVKVL